MILKYLMAVEATDKVIRHHLSLKLSAIVKKIICVFDVDLINTGLSIALVI